MDSLLCPWGKNALTFSLNADTPLLRTLSIAPSVSVLTGYDCIRIQLDLFTPGGTYCMIMRLTKDSLLSVLIWKMRLVTKDISYLFEDTMARGKENFQIQRAVQQNTARKIVRSQRAYKLRDNEDKVQKNGFA